MKCKVVDIPTVDNPVSGFIRLICICVGIPLFLITVWFLENKDCYKIRGIIVIFISSFIQTALLGLYNSFSTIFSSVVLLIISVIVMYFIDPGNGRFKAFLMAIQEFGDVSGCDDEDSPFDYDDEDDSYDDEEDNDPYDCEDSDNEMLNDNDISTFMDEIDKELPVSGDILIDSESTNIKEGIEIPKTNNETVDNCTDSYSKNKRSNSIIKWYNTVILNEFVNDYLSNDSNEKSPLHVGKDIEPDTAKLMYEYIDDLDAPQPDLLKSYTIIAVFGSDMKKYEAFSIKKAAAMISQYLTAGYITSFDEFFQDIARITEEYGIYSFTEA
ncbi:MAG: hypothetical protein K6E28_09800 [Eubacterium sp.]|nr:hypothetical protein [Eubacterium sp.]